MRVPVSWVILYLLLTAAADAQNTPLFVIPTESLLSEPLPSGAALRVALYSRDLSMLAGVLGVPAPEPAAERLEYTLAAHTQLPGRTDRSWLESSFVIDFREPDVVRVYEDLVRIEGDHPSRQQLVEFVSAKITGSHARGWDIASAVARNGEGDCSEYAVLTAALARSAHMQSRVVLGVALVSTDRGHAAYGHAWAELREEGRWVVADAALHGTAAAVRYIPFGVLADEGPGFMLDLAGIMTAWVQRIVLLGSGDGRN